MFIDDPAFSSCARVCVCCVYIECTHTAKAMAKYKGREEARSEWQDIVHNFLPIVKWRVIGIIEQSDEKEEKY